MIMKVRTIGNLQQLTNALLMLNLEKERFIGNIILKSSFQMAFMSVKNLVYHNLARQKISCFISSLVVLTYCYHYYYYYYYYHYYFYYYYLYHYCFIGIIVMIIIVFGIIYVIHFILFHFIFLLLILL